MSDKKLQTQLDGPVPGIPGATIREVESLPEHLEGGKEIGPFTEARPGALLFEIPNIARYLIRDGKTIEVAAYPGADRSAVALFAHGSARATLIHQRGELPLNATTLVSPNWKCVAISGPSGHGKSTIAAELCRRGWLLVADGVTRVIWNGTMAVAWPSDTTLRLWGDACEKLGIETAGLETVRAGIGKYFYPVKTAAAPAALAAIARLRISTEPGVAYFPPNDSTQFVSESTCRPIQIDPLGRRAEHQRLAALVGGACRVLGLDGARSVDISRVADQLARAVQ